MSYVRLISLAFSVTSLLATAAHADPFRMSAKLSCFDPLAGNPPSVGKNVLDGTEIVAVVLDTTPTIAKQFEIAYLADANRISIVRRCDGFEVAQLTTVYGAGNAIGPTINGEHKLARESFLLFTTTWGADPRGGLQCNFKGRENAGGVIAISGSCKGAINVPFLSCEAEFKTAGPFKTKGQCTM